MRSHISVHLATTKFAEIYWTKTGQRIFNVSINGAQVLTNFDIVAAAGTGHDSIHHWISQPAESQRSRDSLEHLQRQLLDVAKGKFAG